MKKLHIFVIQAFIRPFFTSFIVVLFILVLQFISRYKDHLVGKGLEIDVLARVFLYASANLVVLALPISVLLSSLMALGAMGEQYELAAIRSAGISLYRLMFPMGIVAVTITAVSLLFSVWLIPKANLKLFSLLYDIQHSKPAMQLKPGHFFGMVDGYSIRIGEKNEQGNRVYKVMIYDHTRGQGNQKVVMADSGKLYIDDNAGVMMMTLYAGSSHEAYVDPGLPSLRYGRTYFDTLVFRFDISGLGLKRSDEKQFSTHQYMQDLKQLQGSIDSCRSEYRQREVAFQNKIRLYFPDSSLISDDPPRVPPLPFNGILGYFKEKDAVNIISQSDKQARSTKTFLRESVNSLREESEKVRQYQIEYHSKFALPLACFVFLFIGAPLGAIIRRGGIGFPTLISIIFFIAFYVLMMQGRKLGRDEIIPVWMGAWLPVLVLSPIGIILTLQSATDSLVIDLNFLTRIGWTMQKILLRFRRKRSEADTPAPVAVPVVREGLMRRLVSSLMQLIMAPVRWLRRRSTERKKTRGLPALFTRSKPAAAAEIILPVEPVGVKAELPEVKLESVPVVHPETADALLKQLPGTVKEIAETGTMAGVPEWTLGKPEKGKARKAKNAKAGKRTHGREKLTFEALDRINSLKEKGKDKKSAKGKANRVLLCDA